MKFEYKHLVIRGSEGFEELTLLGLEGWELITVIPETGNFLYILKKQV